MKRRLFTVLAAVALMFGIGLAVAPSATATVPGQQYCRSASTADYNDGYAYYKFSPGGTSYRMAQGQCVSVGTSASSVDNFRAVQVGCRFRVYNNDPDSSNYQHYGAWKTISGGTREAPLGGTTKQIVQVDSYNC